MPLLIDDAAEAGGLMVHEVTAVAEVPCVYCRSAISSAVFDFTSPLRQLVRATCPSCDRSVTMLAATWRHESARTLRVQD